MDIGRSRNHDIMNVRCRFENPRSTLAALQNTHRLKGNGNLKNGVHNAMYVLGLSTHPNQTQPPFPSPTLQTVPMPPNHDRLSAILHRRITGPSPLQLLESSERLPFFQVKIFMDEARSLEETGKD
ncbi:hypothetical protein QJS10_CPA03g02098 [Acorus calamus]|uniref:Uncharacterized protein n=1 Tax=Acorus calamus TaxID=4465 RepID=A0AAV9F4N6_ACOCL|nr:hypothetical protein QJS10_CPA03g02098 [Acorus calamus]